MTVLLYHFLSELLQYLLVSKVANKVVALLFVYHTSRGSSFLELLRNTASDALCATSYNGYLSFEIHIFRFCQILSLMISLSKITTFIGSISIRSQTCSTT